MDGWVCHDDYTIDIISIIIIIVAVVVVASYVSTEVNDDRLFACLSGKSVVTVS